jgi:folate-dependent phosphoribosylglycinamide formyltransferase PurN
MQAVEHEMFPEAVEAFAAGRLTVEGRKVVWS